MLRRTLTLATVLGRATVATSLKPVSRRRAAAGVAGAASGLAGRRLFASAADFAKTASGLQVQDLEAGAGLCVHQCFKIAPILPLVSSTRVEGRRGRMVPFRRHFLDARQGKTEGRRLVQA